MVTIILSMLDAIFFNVGVMVTNETTKLHNSAKIHIPAIRVSGTTLLAS